MLLIATLLLTTISRIYGQIECKDVYPQCTLLTQFCSNSVYSLVACRKSCGTCVVAGSDWTSWSKCSKTCGQGGFQTRNRGSDIQTRLCNAGSCSGCENKNAFCAVYSQMCGSNSWVRENCQDMCNTCTESKPINPKWSNWGKYSSCTKTCGGGKKTRQRTCSFDNKCPGLATQTINCNKQTCKGASKGVWNPWSNWGTCSKTCGVGLIKRTRTCSQQGKCVGLTTKKRKCYSKKCKPKTPKPKWSSWGEYSTCTKTCGGGKKTRKRTCSSDNACPGLAVQTINCKQKKCIVNCENTNSNSFCESLKNIYCSNEAFKQNCKKSCDACSSSSQGIWSSWSNWGTCSKSCGTGLSKRSRTCSLSGKCSGSASQQQKCKIQECSSSQGFWSSWSNWGTCSKSCGTGLSKRSRTCSMSGECSGSASQQQKCKIQKCKPSKGVWKPWSTWTKCTKPCGGGQTQRTRECTLPGRCSGPRKQMKSCNSDECTAPSSWSTCTKTCGYGTQYKSDSNGLRTYQGCNKQDCPTNHCIGQVRRKGMPWSCCDNSPQICGQPTVGGRIIGGSSVAKAKEWPFIASLAMKYSSSPTVYKHYCGATLISREWALTAGHCIVNSASREKFDIGRLKLYTGYLQLDQRNNASMSDISQAIEHPRLLMPKNDIALLKLKTKLPTNDFIKPICLPGGEITPEDTKCFIMGWGVTSSDSLVASNNLLDAEVYNFNIDVCRTAYHSSKHGTFVKSSNKIMCAGTFTEGVDSCRGDSGGPLVCQRCQTCNFYVAGIVSFGPTSCASPNFPGVYTKVLAYEDWIQTTAGLAATSGFCSKSIGP